MEIRILDCTIHRIELKTRMPFRYGIATMTRVPHAYVRVRVEADGVETLGLSADLLPPKWFTKDPAKLVDAEVNEMVRVVEHAAATSRTLSAGSPFDLWLELHGRESEWGRNESLAPLLTQFGVSLVERAVIDAACRRAGKPFSEMLPGGGLGLRLGALHRSLEGLVPARFLPARPLRSILVRHTVGLGDPLTGADIPSEERIEDGLPQALDECIRAYQLSHFKIKVTGQAEQDRERLERLARLLKETAAPDFAFSLDGNEQFHSLDTFRECWREWTGSAVLRDFFHHLLFVEQPLHRSVALESSLAEAFEKWPDRPPIIIDESDAELDSLPKALALGYAGASHKNCKGVFKGVANRCLLEWRAPACRRTGPRDSARTDWMSGEDLCTVGPVSLLQDLAVMAALGIESVERNGHHYHPGLSQFPKQVQDQVLEAHPDLYRPSREGWPTLDIQGGRIRLDTVNRAPFGAAMLIVL